MQALRKSLNRGVGIARHQRFLHFRQRQTMILGGERQIHLQSNLSALVGEIGRFDFVQDLGHVASSEELMREKLWQVVSLLLNIDAEFEVLWIDPSDMEIRDVTHGANRQRRVEMRHRVRIPGRDLQRTQALRPA